MRPHGIMFHHFHGQEHRAGQGSISAADLAAMIEFLGPAHILPAQVWLTRALRGDLRKTDLCLTLDDNLRCQYDVALPVLREHRITAFWFISTATLGGAINRMEVFRAFRERCFADVKSFYAAFFAAVRKSGLVPDFEQSLEPFNPLSYLCAFPFYTDDDRKFRFVRDEVLGPQRYSRIMESMLAAAGVDERELARGLWMDDACLRELHADGHVIGLHTHTHPTRLAHLSPAEQEREYRDNYMTLMQLLGQPPLTMSHPCNSYNEYTLVLLRKLGIRVGFRADMDDSPHSELEFPRQDHANVLRQIRMFETASVPL